ncbi:MAG: helix-turn-helix transcriptional regulator [Candidatus Caldatribacterium sp.]|nr:helix-turn-helix transcriptional regulator [Candidatus Caldatribacterium sp.]
MCREHHPECPGFRIDRFLQPCLLLFLFKGPSHGYELMEKAKHLFFQNVPLDPGLLYRTLRRMEEDGLVVSSWVTEASGPAKRVYRITEEGKVALSLWAEHMEQQLLRFQRFLEEYRKVREEEHSG